MKRISLEALEAQYRVKSYQQLYEKIIELIDKNEIKPVIASGKNGKKPALYKEYWLIEKKEDYSKYMDELSYKYVPAISTGYYLKHLKQYESDREYLLLLNEYLKLSADELKYPKSLNERSFEIWHREKFLKEGQGKRILKNCGLDMESLNLYETTEPLAYYVHTRQTPQNMLILENKDTFYSMRKWLIEGNDKILDKPIGTLIYGAGKGIIRSFKDFALCAEPYMRENNNKIYYFGDLDYEGILIYEKLAEVFTADCEIIPFCKAYLKMLEKAENIGLERLPDMKTGQNQNISKLFFEYFSKEYIEKIQTMLQSGKYIPQEILSLTDL